IRKDVEKYVNTCPVCQRSKIRREKPSGLLHPLPTPSRPWEIISADFITDLPPSCGFTTILVVVDLFTKLAHFIPCEGLPTAKETADLFLQHVFRLHGLPKSLVTDRGSQFTSRFWKALQKLLGIDSRLSSAHHPQTDGQTERTNATLEQYLRCYVNYQQDNWASLLPLSEFAYIMEFKLLQKKRRSLQTTVSIHVSFPLSLKLQKFPQQRIGCRNSQRCNNFCSSNWTKPRRTINATLTNTASRAPKSR
uniref:Integrase catalytic domain-containing protein n=1 Tax=Anolis carolinensis TaxID=28377 RepID=A0A803TJH7_ANOCA